MGKKWIVGLMILAALWAMAGCGKQEMIRCEYTNEAAGFTLSIDRPVEWTAKLQEGCDRDRGSQPGRRNPAFSG